MAKWRQSAIIATPSISQQKMELHATKSEPVYYEACSRADGCTPGETMIGLVPLPAHLELLEQLLLSAWLQMDAIKLRGIYIHMIVAEGPWLQIASRLASVGTRTSFLCHPARQD